MAGIKSSGGIRKSSGIATALGTAGTGLRASVLPGGRVTLNAEPKARRGRAVRKPLQVYAAPRIGEGPPRVSVQFGMVNALVPTFGGQPLTYTAGTPPLPMSREITEPGFIILAVNTDDEGAAETAVINFAAEIPEDTEDRGHVVLAYVSVTGTGPNRSVSISQSVTHSLQHQKCGGTTHLWGAV
jgi:hypothetical protein